MKLNLYKIYVATYLGWQFEGDTMIKEVALKTIKYLRATGRKVKLETIKV